MLHAYLVSTLLCLSTLWSTFHMISWTKLLTKGTVPAACFLLFLVPGKSENEYSRNWTGQKPKCLFYQKTHRARRRDGEGPQGGHTPLGAGQPRPRQDMVWAPGRPTTWPVPGGGLAAPGTPSASPSAYILPLIRKP